MVLYATLHFWRFMNLTLHEKGEGGRGEAHQPPQSSAEWHCLLTKRSEWRSHIARKDDILRMASLSSSPKLRTSAAADSVGSSR